MRSVKLLILGVPVTKKNSQQRAFNKATGRSFITQSKQLKRWAVDAAAQLRQQWGGKPPIAAPVRLSALVYRARVVGDLLNYLAAVSDVLEVPTARALEREAQRKKPKPLPKGGVIVNDRQVVELDGSRLLKDAARPRVELTLTVLG